MYKTIEERNYLNVWGTKKKVVNISTEIIVGLLVVLWIYTGLNKLLDFEETRFQMGKSPFIQPIAHLTAVAIPSLELLLAVLLVVKRTRIIGLFGSYFLMLVFTGYIYSMLKYSYFLPCSCGGVLASLSWKNHLVFNIIFLVISFAGIFMESHSEVEVNIKHKIADPNKDTKQLESRI